MNSSPYMSEIKMLNRKGEHEVMTPPHDSPSPNDLRRHKTGMELNKRDTNLWNQDMTPESKFDPFKEESLVVVTADVSREATPPISVKPLKNTKKPAKPKDFT